MKRNKLGLISKNKPYRHQTTAYNRIMKKIKTARKEKGRIIIPTGGGKTSIEAAVLLACLTSPSRKAKRRIHLVLAPRIALLNQLMTEYRDTIGDSYLAVAFHSGNTESDYNKITWSENSTTSPSQLVEEYERAQLMNKDLVIFSTYHSAFKLDQFKFFCGIADESQYCVQEKFHESVVSLKIKKALFFTATEKHTPSAKGTGNNNKDVFGNIIFQAAPGTLIKQGIIVPPRMHHCDATGKNIIEEVIHIIETHEEECVRDNKCNTVKVLFACDGTDSVKAIHEKQAVIQSAHPDYEIFTITSKTGCFHNDVSIPRTEFMYRLALAEKAIVAHFDILSEGIDVDGITGVAIMRNLNHSKLIQTIGRAVRLLIINGQNVKKYALVTVCTYEGMDDRRVYVQDMIDMILLAGFNVNSEDIFETSPGKGKEDDDEVADAEERQKKTKNINTNVDFKDYIDELDMYEKLFTLVNSGKVTEAVKLIR